REWSCGRQASGVLSVSGLNMTRDVRVKRRYSITLLPQSLAVVSRPFAVIALFLLSLAAQAEVRVLTRIKPLQLIAAAVQGETGRPEVLLPPGASPHHFALRPSDVRRVQGADLLYWIGPDMENFLPRVLEGRER